MEVINSVAVSSACFEWFCDNLKGFESAGEGSGLCDEVGSRLHFHLLQYNEAEVQRLPDEGAFELGIPLVTVFLVSALMRSLLFTKKSSTLHVLVLSSLQVLRLVIEH
ncbi:hypothetical protein YC2023_039282 [Brassica napus]